MSNFNIKQLYVLYKPAASVRARYKLIHICQKKSKIISFHRYSEFPFLYRDSREARDLDQAQTTARTVRFVVFFVLLFFFFDE